MDAGEMAGMKLWRDDKWVADVSVKLMIWPQDCVDQLYFLSSVAGDILRFRGDTLQAFEEFHCRLLVPGRELVTFTGCVDDLSIGPERRGEILVRVTSEIAPKPNVH